MDETWTGTAALPQLDPAQVKVTENIEVQARVCFAVVTDASAPDSITQDLAKRLFPTSTRPAVEYLQELAPPGGRVLDLGTHVGSFTLAAAAMGYEVLGVEASPRNAALLNASLKRNGFDRVRLVHAAVSDRPGQLDFAQDGPYGRVFRPGEEDPVVSVRAMRIDDILAEVGWDRVDFIKMDIEGSEITGLAGMTRVLSARDAAPLFIESNGHTLDFFGQTPLALKTVLAAHGYDAYLVEMGRLCPVQVGDFQASTCVDYVAAKGPLKGLKNCRVDRPLSHDETVFRIVRTSHSGQAADRAYIARALIQAPRTLLEAPAVRQAVLQLRQDEDANVRSAAAAIPDVPVRRSWLRGWHRGVAAIPRPHFLRAGAPRAERSRSKSQ